MDQLKPAAGDAQRAIAGISQIVRTIRRVPSDENVEGRTRARSDNVVPLPSSADGIDNPIPSRAEPFPVSEWKFIERTQGEEMALVLFRLSVLRCYAHFPAGQPETPY